MKHKLIMENWKRYLTLSESILKPAKPHQAFFSSGGDNHTNPVILYKNQSGEAVLVRADNKYSSINAVYNVKGEGVGWQTKDGRIHLHAVKGKLPQKIEIDFSFETDQGSSILALKTPASVPHNQEK